MHSALKFHSMTSREDFAVALSLFQVNLHGLLKIKKKVKQKSTQSMELVTKGPESNEVTQPRKACPCCSARDPEQFGAQDWEIETGSPRQTGQLPPFCLFLLGMLL